MRPAVNRVFEVETSIDASAERCFDLARDIGVHVGSMEASGERAIAGVTSGLIGPGEDVTWTARHFGIRWKMTARVTEYDRPARFVDEMLHGPFAAFHHEHRFEAHGPTTIMRDVVTYRLPWGPLGVIADAAFVGRHLRKLLEARGRYIKELAAT